MRPAEGRGTKCANENRQAPAGGDDDPAAVVSFRAGEDNVGDDAVAEEHEQRGSNEFCDVGVHGLGERFSAGKERTMRKFQNPTSNLKRSSKIQDPKWNGGSPVEPRK